MATSRAISAKSKGLVLCHACRRLNRFDEKQAHNKCSRCEARLHTRHENSLERSWALVIASVIVFIPANTLPIMTINSFGSGTPDTILSGIVVLVQLGMLPVAIIVFIASFMVPLGKILGLIILLLTVQRNSTVQPKHRTIMYRVVEFLGKWSMLDVFVVAIMGAVVNLGFITSIEPGRGAAAFAIMVVLTMFAAHAFDPRLIWDRNHNE